MGLCGSLMHKDYWSDRPVKPGRAAFSILVEYEGTGPNFCYTAFAGVTLECPVAYAIARFCLAEIKAV